jgi:rSAM/selenodomain-associated transferase 1
VNLIIIAKAPVPGRAKTRLCPPCTPEQAARLAQAALADTLRAVAATPADRRVLLLDGDPGAWLPGGFELLAQRSGGLDERLAHAFEDVGGPALLIGMDTPQVTPALLSAAMRRLARAHAVLGPALDGGFWALGLRRPDPSLLRGVPMSAADTGARQLERLLAAGLRVAPLPALRDVDRIEDAYEVAADIPGSSFAHALATLTPARRAA